MFLTVIWIFAGSRSATSWALYKSERLAFGEYPRTYNYILNHDPHNSGQNLSAHESTYRPASTSALPPHAGTLSTITSRARDIAGGCDLSNCCRSRRSLGAGTGSWSCLDNLENRDVMGSQGSRNRSPTSGTAAVEFGPGERSRSKTRYIRKAYRECLCAASRHNECNHNTVRQLSCPVRVKLTWDRSCCSVRTERGGCFPEWILIDGQQALLTVSSRNSHESVHRIAICKLINSMRLSTCLVFD